MATREQLVETRLDRAVCQELLATKSVGRLALSPSGWGPVIRPVSYWFDEPSQSIVFRSYRGSKLTAILLSARAAFEVDDVDDAEGIAWSVIAEGVVEMVHAADEMARLAALPVTWWTPGEDASWVRIRPQQLSGRRLQRLDQGSVL